MKELGYAYMSEVSLFSGNNETEIVWMDRTSEYHNTTNSQVDQPAILNYQQCSGRLSNSRTVLLRGCTSEHTKYLRSPFLLELRIVEKKMDGRLV